MLYSMADLTWLCSAECSKSLGGWFLRKAGMEAVCLPSKNAI